MRGDGERATYGRGHMGEVRGILTRESGRGHISEVKGYWGLRA